MTMDWVDISFYLAPKSANSLLKEKFLETTV